MCSVLLQIRSLTAVKIVRANSTTVWRIGFWKCARFCASTDPNTYSNVNRIWTKIYWGYGIRVTPSRIPLFRNFLRIQRVDECWTLVPLINFRSRLVIAKMRKSSWNTDFVHHHHCFNSFKKKKVRNLERTVRRKTFTWIEACANSCGNIVTDFFSQIEIIWERFLFILETSENKRCRISHSCIAAEEMAENAWMTSSYLPILPKRQVNETRVLLIFYCGHKFEDKR